MSALSKGQYISEADYLEGEKVADVRHEYVDGQVYAMAGASRRHNRIALNIAFTLRQGNKDSRCEITSSDIKVRAAGRKTYYYPDVAVGCDESDDNPYYLERPCLIVEVVSKSTEWKDRQEKAVVYQSLDSLQAYLVVAQKQPHVTLYYREQDGGWWVTAFEAMDQVIELNCPQVSLGLADIYEGVDFTAEHD